MNPQAQILLLPRNYESIDEHYLYDNTVYTINKVLNQAGINSAYLDDKPIQVLELRNDNWFLPVLYISYNVLIENKEVYEVALMAIKEYIIKSSPFTRGEDNTVELKVIVEKSEDKTTKSIEYNGSIDGLSDLKDTILRIANE
ncbi:hypothetical protein [Sulfurimonas sp. HSL-1716]|uniref:hypothetical protein n=1 Tax=Hydrocurvibacter sulfurireducens TaxID=3131937 RepID=UPI0031F976DE